MSQNGQIVKVGTKILLCTMENANLTVEELSDGGVLSATAEETTITCNHSDTLSGGEYFFISSPTKDYYVYFKKDNKGQDPKFKFLTPIPVNIYTDNTAAQVATALATALDAVEAYTATAADTVVTVTNTVGGDVPDARDGRVATAFLIETTTQGMKKILFDGTLGKDIARVLDVIIAVDGSAEILVLEKRYRTIPRGMNQETKTDFIPTYLSTAAGWLAL